MNKLRVAYKNNKLIKEDQDESVNELAKIFQANYEKRRLKQLLKKQIKNKK